MARTGYQCLPVARLPYFHFPKPKLKIQLLQDLDHVNIVRVQEMFFSAPKQEVRFVFEYAEYDLWVSRTLLSLKLKFHITGHS